MHSTALILSLFASLVLPTVVARSHPHRGFIKHPIHAARRALVDPNNLAVGALGVSDGCTEFFDVPKGMWCYIVAQDHGISLEKLYALNPAIDSNCSNLFAGESYCVAGTPVASDPVAATPTLANAAKLAIEPTLDSSTSVSVSVTRTRWIPTPTPMSKSEVAPLPVNSKSPITTPSPVEIPSSTPIDTPTPVAAQSSTAIPVAPSSTSAPITTTPKSNVLVAAGITGFLGTNVDAILSWFNPNSASDSTNGHSWCGYPYDSNTPGFAPDVTTMLNNFNGDYPAAATAYCGLVAEVTGKDGRVTRLILVDGFDSKWVRTPSSLDIITGSFASVFGSQTSNKNDVVQGASWKFTGERDPQYIFKGVGSGGN